MRSLFSSGIGANSGFTELVAEEVTKNAQEVLYQRYFFGD
jgi:hypothetical protein